MSRRRKLLRYLAQLPGPMERQRQAQAIRTAAKTLLPRVIETTRQLTVKTEFFTATAVWKGKRCVFADTPVRWMLGCSPQQSALNLLKMEAVYHWTDFPPTQSGDVCAVTALRSPKPAATGVAQEPDSLPTGSPPLMRLPSFAPTGRSLTPTPTEPDAVAPEARSATPGNTPEYSARPQT